jgi:phosphoribosylanthranilate isomerase
MAILGLLAGGMFPRPFFTRCNGERLRGTAKVTKAFRVRDTASLASFSGYIEATDAYLLDAFIPGVRGGTGVKVAEFIAAARRGLA